MIGLKLQSVALCSAPLLQVTLVVLVGAFGGLWSNKNLSRAAILNQHSGNITQKLVFLSQKSRSVSCWVQILLLHKGLFRGNWTGAESHNALSDRYIVIWITQTLHTTAMLSPHLYFIDWRISFIVVITITLVCTSVLYNWILKNPKC